MLHLSTIIMLNTQILISSAALLLCQVAAQYVVTDPWSQPAVPGAKLPAAIDQLGCSRPGGLPETIDPLRRCSTYIAGADLPQYFDPLGCTRPGGLPIWQDPRGLCRTYLPGARYPIGIDSVGWSRPGYSGTYVGHGGLLVGNGGGLGGGAGSGGSMGSGLGGGAGNGGSMGSGLGSGGGMGAGLGSGGGMGAGLGGSGVSFGGMGVGMGSSSGGAGGSGGGTGGSGGSGGSQNSGGSSSQVTYAQGSSAHLQHAVDQSRQAGANKHNVIIQQSKVCNSKVDQALTNCNIKAKQACGSRQDISLKITNEIEQGKLVISQHLNNANNNPDQWGKSYEEAEKAAMHTLHQVNAHLIEAGVSEHDRNQIIHEARNQITASFTESRNEIYKYERWHVERRQYVRDVTGYRMDKIRVETVDKFDRQVDSLNSWTESTLKDRNREIHVHNELVACRNEVQRCFIDNKFHPNKAEDCANRAVDHHIPRVKGYYHEDGVSAERTNEIVDPHRNRMKQIIRDGKEEMERGIQQAGTAGVRW